MVWCVCLELRRLVTRSRDRAFIRLPHGVSACSVASEGVLPTAVLLEKTASLVV